MNTKKTARPTKRTRIVALCILGCLLVLAVLYAWPHPHPGGQRWRASQEDKVRETVFRWQIAEHRSDQTCFLQIDGHAPGRQFMQHFAGAPFVRPAPTTLQMGMAKGKYQFVDPATQNAALLFWTDNMEWVSDEEVLVQGGGAAANGSGNAGTFHVLWNKGRWKVTGYTAGATF